jgi:hypothetical protein
MPVTTAGRLRRVPPHLGLPGRTGLWDTRRSAAVDVGAGYGLSVDDNDAVVGVRDRVGGNDLTQATSGDRPTVDKATIPGATLIETVQDDHLKAAVTGQILTVALAFRDDGASTERHLLSRDTSEATDKPAFQISIIVE